MITKLTYIQKIILDYYEIEKQVHSESDKQQTTLKVVESQALTPQTEC